MFDKKCDKCSIDMKTTYAPERGDCLLWEVLWEGDLWIITCNLILFYYTFYTILLFYNIKMNVVTIPAKYENWVIKPLKKIRKNPSNVFIVMEYKEQTVTATSNKWKIDLNSLVWIIDKDIPKKEYKEHLYNKYSN